MVLKLLDANGFLKSNEIQKEIFERVEAKLVSKGFTQTEGIDFNETFRFILSMFAQIDPELH